MLLLGCKSVKTTTTNSISKETTTVPKYQKLNTFKGTTNDTLAYMRTSIIDRKSKYIGKELKVLLNDLELPINYYLIGSSNLKGISPSLTLYFYPKNVVNIKRHNKIDPVIFTIVWETPLSNKEEFRNIIMRDAFKAIKEAIKNDKTTVELFNIVNLSVIIKLSYLYYPSALKKISNYFEEYEDCLLYTSDAADE